MKSDVVYRMLKAHLSDNEGGHPELSKTIELACQKYVDDPDRSITESGIFDSATCNRLKAVARGYLKDSVGDILAHSGALQLAPPKPVESDARGEPRDTESPSIEKLMAALQIKEQTIIELRAEMLSQKRALEALSTESGSNDLREASRRLKEALWAEVRNRRAAVAAVRHLQRSLAGLQTSNVAPVSDLFAAGTSDLVADLDGVFSKLDSNITKEDQLNETAIPDS
ncbi:MAG: hypothetical protein AAF851_13340 [Myxococcota bacterium]